MKYQQTGFSKISSEEVIKTAIFWKHHAKYLREKHLISNKVFDTLWDFTTPSAIGYDSSKGQIVRPGELGKWDVFCLGEECGFTKEECLLMADITPSELAAEEYREKMREMFVDSDNPDEVREFERINGLPPEQCDKEIAKLEKFLSERQ